MQSCIISCTRLLLRPLPYHMSCASMLAEANTVQVLQYILLCIIHGWMPFLASCLSAMKLSWHPKPVFDQRDPAGVPD